MDMNPDDAPATKGGLKQVQGDLKSFRRAFALEIVKLHARIEKRDELVRGDLRAMSSRITKQIDGFMSDVGKIDRAQVISDWRLTQIEKRVDAIDSRPS